ncbi:MAG: hypothetical protein H0X33_12615 [Taibaiella sp.]|nr:hypothetical protein [Taibaiella sp.]
MRCYKAKLDATAVAITIMVAVLVGISIATTCIAPPRRANSSVIKLLAMGLGFSALVVTYFFKPTAYFIEDKKVHIKRPIGDIVIPLTDIIELKRIYKGDLGLGIRYFGSGGFFGYLGKYYYRSVGKVNIYSTDCSKLVLIRAQKKYIISPDSPDEFINELNSQLHR